MKILITRNWVDRYQDYLSDSIFHGLKSLGEEVVDVPQLWYMYKDEFTSGKRSLVNDVYGRGFTLYSSIDSDNVDRTDIEHKIRSSYFDIIICSRAELPGPYYYQMLESYPHNKIIVLDGTDETHLCDQNLLGKATYFKRENVHPYNRSVHPISFSFPKEKIQKPNFNKSKMMAAPDPRAASSFSFFKEEDYYNEYNKSCFGVTIKKGGWDCMRHYEIMGSRAIPLFLDIDHCPNSILTTLPKKELFDILTVCREKGGDWIKENMDYYYEMEEKIHQHFLKHCTTEESAKYMLDIHLKNR
jgi:hypothetical protein